MTLLRKLVLLCGLMALSAQHASAQVTVIANEIFETIDGVERRICQEADACRGKADPVKAVQDFDSFLKEQGALLKGPLRSRIEEALVLAQRRYDEIAWNIGESATNPEAKRELESVRDRCRDSKKYLVDLKSWAEKDEVSIGELRKKTEGWLRAYERTRVPAGGGGGSVSAVADEIFGVLDGIERRICQETTSFRNKTDPVSAVKEFDVFLKGQIDILKGELLARQLNDALKLAQQRYDEIVGDITKTTDPDSKKELEDIKTRAEQRKKNLADLRARADQDAQDVGDLQRRMAGWLIAYESNRAVGGEEIAVQYLKGKADQLVQEMNGKWGDAKRGLPTAEALSTLAEDVKKRWGVPLLTKVGSSAKSQEPLKASNPEPSVGERQKNFDTWTVNKPHETYPHVVYGKNGEKQPAEGYQWLSENEGDYRVVPKSKPSPSEVNKNLVGASQSEQEVLLRLEKSIASAQEILASVVDDGPIGKTLDKKIEEFRSFLSKIDNSRKDPRASDEQRAQYRSLREQGTQTLARLEEVRDLRQRTYADVEKELGKMVRYKEFWVGAIARRDDGLASNSLERFEEAKAKANKVLGIFWKRMEDIQKAQK